MEYRLKNYLSKCELINERNEVVSYYKISAMRKKSFTIYDEKGNESFEVNESREKTKRTSWNNADVTKYVVFKNGEQIADGRFDFAINDDPLNQHCFLLEPPQVISVSLFGKMGEYFFQLEKHGRVSIRKDDKLFCEIVRSKGMFSNKKITTYGEIDGTLLLCLFCIAKLMVEEEDLIKI